MVHARQSGSKDDARRSNARVQALLAINETGCRSADREFLAFGLEKAQQLTRSGLALLYFINDDQECIEPVTCSGPAAPFCVAADDNHHPIGKAAMWTECLHTKRPFVCNDYTAMAGREDKRTDPFGLTRLVSVPIIEGDKVRMIVGAGDKASDYDADDVETLQLVGNALWRITQGHRAVHDQHGDLLRFKAVFQNLGEAILLHDESGSVVDANAMACDLFAYSHDQLTALNLADLSVSEFPDVGQDALRRSDGSCQPARSEWQTRRHGGEPFWTEVKSTRIAIAGASWVVSVVRDLTERRSDQEAVELNMRKLHALNQELKDAQVQVLQSEKMSSIGQLAAGVAHEINNPVGFVHSNLGTLETYLRDLFAIADAYETLEQHVDDLGVLDQVRALKQQKEYDYLKQDTFQLLEESREGLARVRKIVQDLKDFSRVGDNDWRWTDINQGLDSTLNIVWNELKYKCKIQKDYGELPQIFCLPSQLNQVFMNLLVNAGQAIEEKGEIGIATGVSGNEVWVSIADNGKGIGEENLTRIFEPFYTTKPVGKGTGLGLSLSYSIVKKHKGRIEVDSEVGRGSIFKVILPISPDIEVSAFKAKEFA